MNSDPRLYLIIDQQQALTDDRYTLLLDSAVARGVVVEQLNPDIADWSTPAVLEPGCMLYRITIGRRAGVYERMILHDSVVTFFRNNLYSMRPMGDLAAEMLEARAGVPIVPTIHHFNDDPQMLARYVEYLGGFPVIVKKMTYTSRGVGVMRIDSMASLLSLAGPLLSAGDDYIMRKYIADAEHIRLMVLNDEVIATGLYHRVENDFRTNAVESPTISTYEPTSAMREAAIASVRARGFEFGAVDLLLDPDGNLFVAESNFPNYFPRVQHATGVDISGLMLEHLLHKRKVMLAG